MAAGTNTRRSNGEGSLVLRKDGRWMGRYWITLPDGAKKQQSIISKDKGKVIEALRHEMVKADKGSPVLHSRRTTGEFLQYWLKEIDPHQVRPTTLQRHTFYIRKYLLLQVGKISLSGLRPEHLRMMLNRMKAANCSTRTMCNPAYPSTVRITFQSLARQAGLPPITIHEARHTAATLLAEAWTSPKEAQNICDHAGSVSKRVSSPKKRATYDPFSSVVPPTTRSKPLAN